MMKERSYREAFTSNESITDHRQRTGGLNSRHKSSSNPCRSLDFIPMSVTQYDSRQSSAASRQDRARLIEKLTKTQHMSENMRRYSRDRFNFALLKDTVNRHVPGSDTPASVTDEHDRSSSSRTDLSWRPCCGKAYHAPDMVNKRKSQSVIYQRDFHHNLATSGPTIAGGVLYNKRVQLLNNIRLRTTNGSGTSTYSQALAHAAFPDAIQQRLYRSNSEFRVVTPHVTSQYKDVLFIPIHTGDAGECVYLTSEQNLASTNWVQNSSCKKRDDTCVDASERSLINMDDTGVETPVRFLKRYKTQMNVLISHLPSESSLSEKSLDNANVSINKKPNSGDSLKKQIAGTLDETRLITESESTKKSPPVVSNENQKKGIDRAPAGPTVTKSVPVSQGVTRSGSISDKERRSSRLSSISSTSGVRSRRNTVFMKSQSRVPVNSKVVFPVPDCWVDDVTLSSLQPHGECEEENEDSASLFHQQNNNGNGNNMHTKRVHILEAGSQLDTDTFNKACNIRDECEKHVVHLSQLPNQGLRLPDFICPSSETKSREAAIKQWLVNTNFSCANRHVPLI